MLDNFSIRNIIFYDENVFDANVNNLTYISMNSFNPEAIIEMCKAKKEGDKWHYFEQNSQHQSDLMKDDYLIIQKPKTGEKITQKMEIDSLLLKSFAKVNFGMQLRDRKKFPNDVTSNRSELTPYHKKCYTGKNIERFIVKYDNIFCYYNRHEAKCGGCWDEKVHFSSPKILVRQIGAYPIAGMDLDGNPVLNTAFMITLTNAELSIFSLLGIINSNLMKYYWKSRFMDSRKQFPKIKGTYLEKLPIKKTSVAIHKRIHDLVNQILNIKQSDPASDTSTLEAEIDRLVYELYGLTEEEIKIVEDSVK
jgi:hypothetical protein